MGNTSSFRNNKNIGGGMKRRFSITVSTSPILDRLQELERQILEKRALLDSSYVKRFNRLKIRNKLKRGSKVWNGSY